MPDKRIIKFKRYCKSCQKWHIDLLQGKSMIFNLCFSDIPLKSEYREYTGYIDMNGNEIYEGDVIIETDDAVKKEKHLIVKWEDGGFRPFANNNDEYNDKIYDIKKVKIIGHLADKEEEFKYLGHRSGDILYNSPNYCPVCTQ